MVRWLGRVVSLLNVKSLLSGGRAVWRNYGRDKVYYRIVDDLFGFTPHNIELYKLALIHKSASLVFEADGNHHGRPINNERLEFLGDAVIGAVISDYLYIEFPDEDEGFLTKLRSKIVSRQSHNTLAHRLGLDAQVIANSNGSANQKHIHGDAFEAMIGAIYLDKGYNFVNRLLINRIFREHLDLEHLLEEETDFKSRLIEWCQKAHHRISFETTHGKGHSSNHPVFNATVVIDGIRVGHGQADTKKEAEQRAASSVSYATMSDEQVGDMLDKMDKLFQRNNPEHPIS